MPEKSPTTYAFQRHPRYFGMRFPGKFTGCAFKKEMKYTTLTLLVFSVFLLQNCGGKDISDALVPTTSIQIQKEFLLGGLPELQFETLDTINLEAKGIPPISSVQDIAFSQNIFSF